MEFSCVITAYCVLQVLALADAIKAQIPENIDYETTAKILSVDPSPLNVVLLQEVRLHCLLLSLQIEIYGGCCDVMRLQHEKFNLLLLCDVAD